MSKTTNKSLKTTNLKHKPKKINKKTYKPKKKYVPKGTTKPKVTRTDNNIEKTFTFSKEKPIELEEIVHFEEVSTEEEEAVIPYNDELSTVVEEPIPYNDSISTVEEVEEVIPYNDELSTVNEKPNIEEVIDYYNEEVEEEKKEPNEETSEEVKNLEIEIPDKVKKESAPSFEVNTPTKAFITTGVILTIGLSIMVVYLLYKAFAVGDIENIRYKENSTITYTINKNDGNSIIGDINSDTNVSSKDINNITVNTNYNYNTNTISNLGFTYYYLAKLRILNEETNEELYTKIYKLSNSTTKKMLDKNDYSLSTSIEVDYQDYLSKSDKMIKKYANAKSYLDICLVIKINSLDNNKYSLSLDREPFIRLSLSENELTPEITNIKTEERVFNRPKVTISKPMRLIEGILLAFLTIIILIYTIQLVYDNKKE